MNGQGQEGALDKFLTPETMLMPGAAGGLTVIIANALSNTFGVSPSYIGLAISFLRGLFGNVICKMLPAADAGIFPPRAITVALLGPWREGRGTWT